MWEYAQALRILRVDATALTFAQSYLDYRDDYCLHLPVEPSIWKRRWKLGSNFLKIAGKYDVIHFHFGGTLLPHHLDLPLLRLLGQKMLMNYWGSDVRFESLAEAHNPYYKLIRNHDQNDELILHNIRAVSRYVKVAVVGDRELYDYVSPFFRRTVIIRSAINTEDVKLELPNPSKDVPLIVHAPSHKGIKGTQYVEEAISHLKRKYRFRFLLLHEMTNHQVKEALEQADIVVDQLLLGVHGIFALEAMASGKPVICYIRDDLLDEYPPDFPIVNANPDTIESELERLLANPQLRTEIGKKSRRYVERHHDSRVVAQKLIELYKSL